MPQAAHPPAAVLLLTLWHESGGQWHARVVATDGSVREFTSPLELARWSSAACQALARTEAAPSDDSAPRGLR